MRALLDARAPDHGVLGEEHGATRTDADWRWVLDPIDGTRAFISGFPTWVTLIGLAWRGVPVLGLIDAPAVGARVWGHVVGADGVAPGAWIRDPGGEREARVRPCASIGAAILSTTSPDLFTAPTEREGWARVRDAARLVRYGGDGFAYALLAAGRLDGIVESGLQPYDMVAPIAVVRAAGGLATGVSGDDPLAEGALVAAGDPAVHAALRRAFRG